ncbi:hypothetical protein BDR04DRAFT_1148512 [Suillus decipiens]|nr:hypothetical protein BDR04DRAFT_1148512 [Suillus decipiens]
MSSSANSAKSRRRKGQHWAASAYDDKQLPDSSLFGLDTTGNIDILIFHFCHLHIRHLRHRGNSRTFSVIYNTRSQISAAMASNDHPRTKLNNELQKIYGPSAPAHIRWETHSQGRANNLIWHATVYIDDMNYGYASSSTVGNAQDRAAEAAYNYLTLERSSRR